MNEMTSYSGTKIKQVLTDQGRRQDWLAAQVGVATSTVSRWVNGELPIRFDHAQQVAALLGVSFFDVAESRKGEMESREAA